MKTASKTLITFKPPLPYYLYFALLKVEFWGATATYSPQTWSTTIAVAAPAVAICLNSLLSFPAEPKSKMTKESKIRRTGVLMMPTNQETRLLITTPSYTLGYPDIV